MEHFFELLLHALIDTVPLLPWILVMYIIMQLLENQTTLKNSERLSGRLGPVVGAATGLIPQCGFSVMAAKFYEKKYITLGTLLAIFTSTSDEAFILLVSSGEGAVWVLPTVVIKMAVGIAVGYLADCLVKWLGKGQVCVEVPRIEENAPQTTHEIFMQRYLEEKEVEVVCSCGKNHGGNSKFGKYFLSPLLHTLQVAAFIFLVNFALTAVIHAVGEDAFASFMYENRFLQPFLSAAIGLIPNCASSVVLTETFLSGGIAFGSFVGGLCANAGMGFVILLKNTKKWKRNLLLILVCYLIAVSVGLICNLFPFTI
ncbi:MAG: arsenic efflux protein [Clostridia bacterium]|nr:arsenic efflux protein [Clostridia bacterium]